MRLALVLETEITGRAFALPGYHGRWIYTPVADTETTKLCEFIVRTLWAFTDVFIYVSGIAHSWQL